MSTASHPPVIRRLPIDAAARTVIARKGIPATTIADISAEAGRSTASIYNYYDSKKAMVLGPASPTTRPASIQTLANVYYRAIYGKEA